MSFRNSIIFLTLASGRLMAQAPEGDIRGPKPPVEIPQPEKFPFGLWAGVAGCVLLAVIGLLVWRWLARRKRRMSPPEIALASLAELEKTRDQLAAEAFANQAAGTVREYIAGRFGIAAPRRTTEEFFHELSKAGMETAIGGSDHLKAFLKSCDLAKFAGSNLDAAQRRGLIQAARGFVTATSVSNIKEGRS